MVQTPRKLKRQQRLKKKKNNNNEKKGGAVLKGEIGVEVRMGQTT